MILNPVIVVSGESGSKKYTITDNVGVGFQASAEAGEIVSVYGEGTASLFTITDAKGNNIPQGWSTSAITRAPGAGGYYYFVMPASNVTISPD